MIETQNNTTTNTSFLQQINGDAAQTEECGDGGEVQVYGSRTVLERRGRTGG